MNNWRKYWNFRIDKTGDSDLHIINVDGEEVQVSEQIYKEYAYFARKMKYAELDLKFDRTLKDSRGRVIKDNNGMTVILPEREVSLEMLMDGGSGYLTAEQQPEDAVIQMMEQERLYCCLDYLEDDERALVQALFFEGMTLRVYAELTGKSKSAIYRLKIKVLGKLRDVLVN